MNFTSPKSLTATLTTTNKYLNKSKKNYNKIFIGGGRLGLDLYCHSFAVDVVEKHAQMQKPSFLKMVDFKTFRCVS